MIEAQFRRILAHKIEAAGQVLGASSKRCRCGLNTAEITTLAKNMVLAASLWMSLTFACDSRATQEARPRGAFHDVALAHALSRPAQAGTVQSGGEALYFLEEDVS
jgi:hypothetical protein